MNLRPIKTVAAKGAELRPEDRAWDKLQADALATLRRRMKEFEAPPFSVTPAQDIALVYRLPNDYRPDEHQGIIAPDEWKHRHELPFSIGLLLWAGAEAMDVLASHGILIGDLVQFARYAGDEEEASQVSEAIAKVRAKGGTESQAMEAAKQAREKEMGKKKLLRLQAPFIHGSFDLTVRLFGEKPTMELVREVNAKGEPVHVFRPIV